MRFLKQRVFNRRLLASGLLAFGICIALYGLVSAAPAERTNKVVLLVVDNLSVEDFSRPDLPNFRRIIQSGGTGLVNNRTESLISVNRSSAFLTIGMGVRTDISGLSQPPLFDISPQTDGFGRAAYRNINELRELVNKEYPNYQLGKIGVTARQTGRVISFIGNADTDKPHHEAGLMAMDNRGVIDYADTGKDLLVRDRLFPGGRRTDPGKLLNKTLAALKFSDIIVVDYGDTLRLREAGIGSGDSDDTGRNEDLFHQTLRNIDGYIGQLLIGTWGEQLTLVVFSPMVSDHEISRINTTLAPIIIYEQGQPAGTLTSGTTRRNGLVSNIDLGPTVFERLGSTKDLNFLGEAITVKPEPRGLATVQDNLANSINLKKLRYFTHGLNVTLMVVVLLMGYLSVLKSKNIFANRYMRGITAMVIALPPVSFLIPLVTLQIPVTDQVWLYLTGALIFVTTALAGLAGTAGKHILRSLAWFSIVTLVFLIVDSLTGAGLLQETPLGFDDVFMGGRYYGINNDSMGILLGSAVFALFYLLEMSGISRLSRLTAAAAVFVLVIITQTPRFGANVGGTIAAMTTAVLVVMALGSKHRIKKSKVVFTVALVFMVELVIAYLDYKSGAQTHAGRVISTLLNQGFGSKFIEILQSKLGLFGLMLVLPPYNLLLAAQLGLYYLTVKRERAGLQQLYRDHTIFTRSFEVIAYGGLVTFMFNDTGVIATALMMNYLTVPLVNLVYSGMNTERL